MPDKIDHATAGLAEFSATGNPAGIEKAVDSLEEFDIWSLNPNQRLAARQRLLTSWGLVLMAIDRIKEPGSTRRPIRHSRGLRLPRIPRPWQTTRGARGEPSRPGPVRGA